MALICNKNNENYDDDDKWNHCHNNHSKQKPNKQTNKQTNKTVPSSSNHSKRVWVSPFPSKLEWKGCDTNHSLAENPMSPWSRYTEPNRMGFHLNANNSFYIFIILSHIQINATCWKLFILKARFLTDGISLICCPATGTFLYSRTLLS